MENEYADDQIGDLQDDEDIKGNDELLGDDIFNDAVNEYIESQKLGKQEGRKLYHDFKDPELPDEVVPVLRKTKEAAQLEENMETEEQK